MSHLSGSTVSVSSSFSTTGISPFNTTFVTSLQKASSASNKKKAIKNSKEQGGDKCGRSTENWVYLPQTLLTFWLNRQKPNLAKTNEKRQTLQGPTHQTRIIS